LISVYFYVIFVINHSVAGPVFACSISDKCAYIFSRVANVYGNLD